MSSTSAIVLNHERFAREVLGRWFKHQKFASFVRQLNMYGFHKIPHLQQGVLKSDSDTEPWHFEHPNFHRGQPDLLCLIQRKKQPTHGPADEPVEMMQDSMHPPPAALPANLTQGQVMDINTILGGITAIKRHQQAISSDLGVLKQSNDALWKEAVAARQRHAKHQDTINRILKFLAGVFGHNAEAPHETDDSHSPPQVTPRIRQRLMIGDGRSPGKGKGVDIIEVEDEDAPASTLHGIPASPFSTSPWTVLSPQLPADIVPGSRFATIEPQDGSVVSLPVTPAPRSEAYSPISEVPPEFPALRPSDVLSRANSTAIAQNGLTNGASSRPASPQLNANGLVTTQAQNGVEPMWQLAIQHLLSNPTQLQRLMQSMANQQLLPTAPPSDPTPGPPQPSQQVTTYDPNQASLWFNLNASPSAGPPAAAPSAPSAARDRMKDPSLSLCPIYTFCSFS
jgi:hypothetical protein